jgi:hypothetical protein
MLYIVNIDDCTFRMYGTNISQTGVKVLHKQGLVAKSHEPAYNETVGRVAIYNFQKGEKFLSHKPVSEIILNGTLYATAEGFVSAFNTMMAACCCGGSGGSGDYTEIITAIENLGDRIIANNCCDECNDWSVGAVENATKVFDANTLHSITIIVETGTVNVSNGTENADLIEGESVTWTATKRTLNQEVTITATSGKAIWAIITCAEVTTTTTPEAVPESSTTTTEEVCILARIGTTTPDYVSEFPSKTGGGGPV